MNTDILARLTGSLADRYEVRGELGAGGMATVYRAVDRKHQRDVAIKVLHPDLGVALGGERFLSEIRTTARLQHPHILPLLDSGDADGLLYYVMPLVTGETLRARLEREKQLPIDDAIAIAREVADALGYAHNIGVIHRDIKPENILLRDGHAMVADFGIALAVEAAGARMTQTGLSLGTPQYMSPEQAMGERTIDRRSDLYSLGAVAYEMLVGEPPFTGPTVQVIVARILAEEPRSLASQRKAVPAGVDHAITRALQKLPADRFSTAAEFRAALDGDAPSSARRRPRARSTSSAHVLALAAGALAMLAIGAGVATVFRRPTPAREPVRKLTITLPDSMRVAFKGSYGSPGGQGSVNISADGRRIAWVGTASHDGIDVRLYVRDMGSFVISAVPGSAGAFAPFLSKDGSRLGYFSGRELQETNLANRETRVLARDLVLPSGATYLGNGSIIMALESGQLTMIAPGGATRSLPVSATAGGRTIGSINFPRSAAGDRYVVGVIRGGPLAEISLADGAIRRIRPFAAGDSAAGIIGGAPKAAGGRLYWLERDVVLSAAFDAEGARLTSDPVPVVSGVRGDVLGAADFDVADDGTVVFVAGADPSIGPLAWLDRQGRVDTLALPPADYEGFDISPDGRSLLTKSVTAADATEIRVFDLARGVGSLLDVGTGDISQPGWSADGRFALVSVAPRGVNSSRVLRVAVDGRSPPDTIMPGALDRQAVSPDGKLELLQISRSRSANRYLTYGEETMMFASRNQGAFEELTSLRGFLAPALSPDGKWVTYEKYGVGEGEIYIERFPLDGHPTRVPGDGGYEAIFSAKGDKIFYRLGDRIVEVAFTVTRDRVSFSTPKTYVKFGFADFLGRGYKVGNDDRMLVKLLPSTTPQSEIRVMTGTR
jgi:eukaryotic-like serine/threonine-protein kinase